MCQALDFSPLTCHTTDIEKRKPTMTTVEINYETFTTDQSDLHDRTTTTTAGLTGSKMSNCVAHTYRLGPENTTTYRITASTGSKMVLLSGKTLNYRILLMANLSRSPTTKLTFQWSSTARKTALATLAWLTASTETTIQTNQNENTLHS